MREPLIIKKMGSKGHSQRAIMVRGPISGALGRRVEIDTSPWPMFLDRDQLTTLIEDLIARRDEFQR